MKDAVTQLISSSAACFFFRASRSICFSPLGTVILSVARQGGGICNTCVIEGVTKVMGADSNQLQNAVSRSLSGTIDVWTMAQWGSRPPVATRWLRLTQD